MVGDFSPGGFPVHKPLTPSDVIVEGEGHELVELNESGKIPDSSMPTLAIHDVFVVDFESEMTSLAGAQKGDVCIRTDVSKTFILKGDDPSVLQNWVEVMTPSDLVQSVFGRQGNVVAENGDYRAGQIWFDPVGNLSSMNVGDALAELDAEKANKAHDHVKAEIVDFEHHHVKAEIVDFEHTHPRAEIVNFDHTHPRAEIVDFEHTHPRAEIVNFDHTHPQSESHYSADTDASPDSIHHTLGTGANQARPGNLPFGAEEVGAIPYKEKGAPGGVAELGPNGKLVDRQVPKIAVTDVFVVASEPAMLSIPGAERGDIAVRTDVRKNFILSGNNPSELSEWVELLVPYDLVQSVFGRFGNVVPAFGDYPDSLIPVSGNVSNQFLPHPDDLHQAIAALYQGYHPVNSDRYLSTQQTRVFHVDGGRTDSYVPNGSPTRPFKSIGSCMLAIPASGGAVLLYPGTYPESPVVPPGVSIRGHGSDVTVISGSLTLSGTKRVTVEGIKVTGTLTNNAPANVVNCHCSGRVVANNAMHSFNLKVVQTGLSGPAVVINTTQEFVAFGLMARAQGNQPALVQNAGNCFYNGCKFENVSVQEYTAMVYDGLCYFDSTQILNGASQGKSLFVNTDNPRETAHIFDGMLVKGDVYTHDSAVVVNDGFYGGTIHGNELIWNLDWRYYTKTEIDLFLTRINSVANREIHVSLVGNDTTGNGSFGKPFRTVQKAMDSIVDAADGREYIVLLEHGTYIESPTFALKAFVNIVGKSKTSCIVAKIDNSPVRLHVGHNRSRYENMTFGPGGLVVTRTDSSPCSVTLKSVMVTPSGGVRFTGNNVSNVSVNQLFVAVDCEMNMIEAEDVSVLCESSKVDYRLEIRGVGQSYIYSTRVSSALYVDNKGNPDKTKCVVYLDATSYPKFPAQLILAGNTNVGRYGDGNVVFTTEAEGIFAKIQGTPFQSIVLQDILKELGSKMHKRNTDEYILLPPGGIVHVDASRADSYNQTGTVIKPFKSIAAAIATNSLDLLVHVAPGTYIGSLSDSPGHPVNVCGSDIVRPLVVGNVVVDNHEAVIRNLTVSGNVTTSKNLVIERCEIAGHIVVLGSASVVIKDSIVTSTIDSPTVQMDSNGILTIDSSVLQNVHDSSVIDHDEGVVDITDSKLTNISDSNATVKSYLAAMINIFRAKSSEIANLGAGRSVDLANSVYDPLVSAPADAPENYLMDLVLRGSATCGLAPTLVENVTVHSGTLSGHNLLLRPCSQIRNDSFVQGVTVKDAFEEIAPRAGPTSARPASPMPGYDFLDTDLGKPIWWAGNRWVDALGARV